MELAVDARHARSRQPEARDQDGGVITDESAGDPKTQGVFVSRVDVDVDVDGGAPRGFRGISPFAGAMRSGSQTELLFAEGRHLDVGFRIRLGTLDLGSGCMKTSAWTPYGGVTIDPVRGGVILSRPPPKTEPGAAGSLERWDLATLTPSGAAPAPSGADEIVYDAKSDVLVTSTANDRITSLHPVTLGEIASLTLSVEPLTHLSTHSLRPGHGQVIVPFMSRCTSAGPTSRSREPREPLPWTQRKCLEGPIHRGFLLVGLSPLALAGRLELGIEDFAPRSAAWTGDGKKLVFDCANERCEWEPDRDSSSHRSARSLERLPDPPSWMTVAPDGDRYAQAISENGMRGIEVRSLMSGKRLWSEPFPR